MDERLELCFEALMCRHNALKGIKSDVSPVHWQYGAIARLGKGETIDKYLENGYSTISLGYIGLYELTKLMKGVSHTDPAGKDFALRVMNRLRGACDKWKAQTGLGYLIVYGSQVFNMDLVMTSVVILAAAAVVMYQLVLWVEKILNRFWGKGS